MSLSLDLAGQAVLVTGASGGMGAGIARRLAEAGARVVVGYHRNAAGAEAVAADCPGAMLAGGDLAAPGGAEALFEAALAAAGRLDGLVNCAGPQGLAPFATLAPGDFSAMFAAHVNAPATLIRLLAARAEAEGQPAAVVNIASVEASRPAPGHAHYATAKAGLVMLTKAAALEFGRFGVRVNAVSPGLVARPGIERDWPEGVARWQDAAPLARLGTPRDIADATAFLLSPLAGWITGAELVVDGGMGATPGW